MAVTKKEQIIKEIMDGTPDQFEGLVQKAIRIVENHHRGEMRYSGEETFTHLLKVAKAVTKIQMDTDSIISALLHQSLYNPEKRSEMIQNIQETFGDEVLELVTALDQINNITRTYDQANTKAISNYLISNTHDIRAPMIKICDSLQNVKTLEYLPREKRNDLVNKVYNVYGPTAEYLNLNELKRKLEDTTFKNSDLEMYNTINKLLAENNITPKTEKAIKDQLETILEILGYKAEIKSRIKGRYSIYRKIKKYLSELETTSFKNIKDIIGYKIILQEEQMCEDLSKAIQELTVCNPKDIENYITHPKPNGYAAIHMNIQIPEYSDILFEVQILTPEMYITNEYGPASHIAYKASLKRFTKTTNEYVWVQDLHKQVQEHINQRETERSTPIRGRELENIIFATTPKGRLIQLEKGQTAGEFAYKVHKEIGQMATAAIIDGKPAKLSTPIESGQTVEIVVDRNKLRK